MGIYLKKWRIFPNKTVLNKHDFTLLPQELPFLTIFFFEVKSFESVQKQRHKYYLISLNSLVKNMKEKHKKKLAKFLIIN